MASSVSSSSCRLAFAVLVVSLLFSFSYSDTYSSQTFSNNRFYKHCTDLPMLNAFLHWSYDQSQSTLSIAFIASPSKPDGWISWALNPTGQGMIGAQALMACKDSDGRMTVKTYNIISYGLPRESKFWFDVIDFSAESSDGVIRLFATLLLPKMAPTTINQLWQVGPSVVNGVPHMHDFKPANMNARGTLDLLSGLVNNGSTRIIGSKIVSRTRRKNIHGILNVVSWGILFPTGVMIARFLKQFECADPAWFFTFMPSSKFLAT